MEFTTSKQRNKKPAQKLETNMQIPENFTEQSIRMAEALDESGAGADIVLARRQTFLWRERMEMIATQLAGTNVECFHFGSQSEGTTIPALQSDIDFLFSYNTVNIMRVWGDWEAGMLNCLMLHDDLTPPQQYLLQVIKNDTPEPETILSDDLFVRKDSGQVLLSADRFKQEIEHRFKDRGEIIRNGPSVSYRPNWDIVQVLHVRKPLPEIQHWIGRCRGRHWPPSKLLNAARVAPCFLVPAGHQDSDYKREEWRLSPSLIERMLMFSLNMTQLKCFIVLKLIKKLLFCKIVEDSVTSFHCKTILFFTIERTHHSLWFEHNLMFLLWRCLNILRKCLFLGRLPHYIINGMNLFDGKIPKVQQRRLLVYTDSMIRNNLQDVFDIGIFKMGCVLQACSMWRSGQDGELGRGCARNSISLQLAFECIERLRCAVDCLIFTLYGSNTTLKDIIYVSRKICEYSTNGRLKTVVFPLIKHFYALTISMQSSQYLRLQNGLDREIIRRFQYSLNTDVASSCLKFASIMYCCGYFRAAVCVLEEVEKRYHNKVKAVCGCRSILREGDIDLQVFANMKSGNRDSGLSELTFALCVKFFRQEIYCTPPILLFEMNRNITVEEVAQRHLMDRHYMDCAEVDARPFLYYLQYLTYGGLGERNTQLHAVRTLKSYLYDARNHINLHHPETALNLLGHCYEMEGDYNQALHHYAVSLRHRGTNNAANWHVLRVLRLMNG